MNKGLVTQIGANRRQSFADLTSGNMVVVSDSDRLLVPKSESPETSYHQLEPPLKKRKVNFNLTIDIKHEYSDACGPNSLSDFSDGESLSEVPVPLPTTPGGKPQVINNFYNYFILVVFEHFVI